MNASAVCTHQTSQRRAFWLLVLACVLAGFLVAAAPSFTASADAAPLNNQERDYINRVNDLRASLGLNRLFVDQNTVDLATSHTAEMVATQNLHHTPDLTAGLTTNWTKVGENVGYGSNNVVVFNAFVNSPHHYENLVDPEFTHIGVSVMVDANGIQWTTHRFVGITPARIFIPPPAPIPAPVAQPQDVRIPAVIAAPAGPIHLPAPANGANTGTGNGTANGGANGLGNGSGSGAGDARHASALLDALHGI